MDGILFCCFKDIHLPFSLNESQIRESIFESKKSCLSFCSNMMKSESRTQSDTMITLLLLFFLITATLTFSSILLLELSTYKFRPHVSRGHAPDISVVT